MISLTSKYAIKTMLEISNEQRSDYVRVTELAKKIKVPAPYLAKIVKRLVRTGFLEGRKGPGGGVRISSKGKKASFFDICEANDEPLVRHSCFLSRTACQSQSPCALHHSWSKIKESVFGFLKKSKIGDF